jgi:hypothetical protein
MRALRPAPPQGARYPKIPLPGRYRLVTRPCRSVLGSRLALLFGLTAGGGFSGRAGNRAHEMAHRLQNHQLGLALRFAGAPHLFELAIEPARVGSGVGLSEIQHVPWYAIKVSTVARLKGLDVREYQVVMRGRKSPKKSR